MNSHLNEKTTKTEKVIHLMTTTLCDRNCKYCCNKQYSFDEIPTVTKEELSKAKIICLTGGEPFAYSAPNEIAKKLKSEHRNIEKVYVYTNAVELADYLLRRDGSLTYIDGVNISIKNKADVYAFTNALAEDPAVVACKENQLYVFDGLIKPEEVNETIFKYIAREWQPDFKPADDSIFRRV